MASVQDLMNSIAQMEGFNSPGTIAQRNNNPGNLRWAANQIGQEDTVNGKFATFASPEDGWLALQNYIQTKADSGVSLRDFIYTYAPPTENDTSGYLNFLSGKLGIGADNPLSDLYASTLDIGGNIGSDVSDLFSGDTLGVSNTVLAGIGAVLLVVLLVKR